MNHLPESPDRSGAQGSREPSLPAARAVSSQEGRTPPKGRPLGCLLLIVALLAGAGFASVQFYKKQGAESGNRASKKGPTAVPVTVGKVTRQTVPIELHAVGNVLSYSTVAITSQVTGQVMKVHFKQGDFVKQGQVLFTIDARPQEATLQQVQATTMRDSAQISQATATLAKDEANVSRDLANLRQAEANLARDRAQQKYAAEQERRYRDLLKQGYVTIEQYGQMKATAGAYVGTIRADEAAIASARASLAADRATLEADRASVRGLEATLQADQAVVQGASVQVGYTVIRSPMDGRTGSLTAYEGNVVRANDVTALVTINQITPIFVTFALPEQFLTQVRARQKQGPLMVQAVMSGQKNPAETGRVTFFENAVDTTTGTITLRATFPNRTRRLWPGRFVNVNVLLGEQRNVVVAPAQAIQAGQEGDYVFVVKEDETVEVRPVKVDRTAEPLAVIASGLKAGETVVTDGQLQLTPGAKVQVRTGKAGQGKRREGGVEAGATPAPAQGPPGFVPGAPTASPGVVPGGTGPSSGAVPGGTTPTSGTEPGHGRRRPR